MDQQHHLDWIIRRRSIRRYTGETIPDESIRELLRAAMYAPSAVNRQPWHFIVITDREIFRRIAEIHPYSSFIVNASHGILVCGDENLQHDDNYYLPDCGAATENILLAAYSMGIGSCWIGIYPRMQRVASFSELFNLPGHVKPFSLISLGYPAEEKALPDRFRPDRIRYNRW